MSFPHLFLLLYLVVIIVSSLSSYVARHSYATNAKKLGVPTAVISEALGHTSEKTTQVYLDSFENEVVDRYHDMVIDLPNKVES